MQKIRVTVEVVVDIELNTNDVTHKLLDYVRNEVADAVDIETQDLIDNFNVLNKNVECTSAEEI